VLSCSSPLLSLTLLSPSLFPSHPSLSHQPSLNTHPSSHTPSLSPSPLRLWPVPPYPPHLLSPHRNMAQRVTLLYPPSSFSHSISPGTTQNICTCTPVIVTERITHITSWVHEHPHKRCAYGTRSASYSPTHSPPPSSHPADRCQRITLCPHRSRHTIRIRSKRKHIRALWAVADMQHSRTVSSFCLRVYHSRMCLCVLTLVRMPPCGFLQERGDAGETRNE
jgi:hypothetical protein